MRRNQPSEAPGLRAKLARGSAGFGAGPNKRDFSGFGGGRNLKNSQVYRHLHRLPFNEILKKQKNKGSSIVNLRFSGFLYTFGGCLHNNKLFFIHGV